MKIFRRIRHQLFTANRFTRYFLYAIGEIILVVLGILIALEINAHNDFKTDRSKECAYFSSLLTDLNNQRSFLEAYSLFDREVIRNGDSLIQNYYDRGAFEVDDAFSRQVSILNNRSTFRKYDTTYKELLATGGLNLILDPELKQEIMKYYQTIEQYEIIIRQNNEYVDNHFAPLALKLATHFDPHKQHEMYQNIMDKGYLRPEFNKSSDAESRYYKTIQERLNDPEYRLEFLNQVQYRYRISAVHLSVVDDLLEQSLKLSERIGFAMQSCP